MRRPRLRSAMLAAAGMALATMGSAQAPVDAPAGTAGAFRAVFAPGSRDAAGRLMGGTEMRVLEGHSGKLYAGNGYWEDLPGPEGPKGAQILVLDSPGSGWRVDHDFDERMPSGRPRDLAVSALNEVGFATDWRGTRLPQRVTVLLAAVWDLTGTARAFARDDATGEWSATTLAEDRPKPNFLPQLRSFGMHRDRVTGGRPDFCRGQSARDLQRRL